MAFLGFETWKPGNLKYQVGNLKLEIEKPKQKSEAKPEPKS